MVLSLAATTITAQRVMTIDQCVSDALLNNVKMKNAGNDVEAARQAKKQAFTKYFPTVSATGRPVRSLISSAPCLTVRGSFMSFSLILSDTP